MLAILGRAKGRSDEPRDLVRPGASILCTLVSHRCQHPQFGRGLGMYLDHIGTVDMFGAGYSLCTPREHMAEEYSDIQPSQYLPSLSVYSHCEPLSIDTSTHLIGTIILFL